MSELTQSGLPPIEDGTSSDVPDTKIPVWGEVYVGTKIIRAEPMSNEYWLRSKNQWEDGQETAGDGYKVQYEDGYTSWSPKGVFERCYRKLSPQEVSMVIDI